MPVPPWEWRKAGLVPKFGGEYDLNEMRVGKAIDHSNDACVVPRATLPPKTKVKYALLAAVPAAVVLGAVLTAEKKAAKADDSKADPGAPE
jgi:hypothetical protein